mmetsp:Transcript_101078/g.324689  ORF Transcript_101078/g.324689 Transcript_101078/m.324689 type:complete len:222 (+) Transcript_101078:1325-1990(+)
MSSSTFWSCSPNSPSAPRLFTTSRTPIVRLVSMICLMGMHSIPLVSTPKRVSVSASHSEWLLAFSKFCACPSRAHRPVTPWHQGILMKSSSKVVWHHSSSRTSSTMKSVQRSQSTMVLTSRETESRYCLSVAVCEDSMLRKLIPGLYSSRTPKQEPPVPMRGFERTTIPLPSGLDDLAPRQSGRSIVLVLEPNRSSPCSAMPMRRALADGRGPFGAIGCMR